MHKAFTMIEIIFVIMIIGILSAVALPKLIDNRDSGRAAMCMQSSKRFLQDMATYYTVYGKFGTISKMSNLQIGDDDVGFLTDINMNTTFADFYCEGEALARFEIEYKTFFTKLKVSSLSPNNALPAIIANQRMKENNFFRGYDLGGYSH